MSNTKAFTLIELLLVTALLIAVVFIALSGFSQYRKRAQDASAQSDLRNAATAEEAYFVNTATYITCTDTITCEALLPGIQGFSLDTTIDIEAFPGYFTGTSTSTKGSGTIFSWNSNDTTVMAQSSN